MSDAVEEYDGKVSISSRNITNLRLADDIDALAEEEQELEDLVEISTQPAQGDQCPEDQLMTNSADGIQRER